MSYDALQFIVSKRRMNGFVYILRLTGEYNLLKVTMVSNSIFFFICYTVLMKKLI